ncbi:MAG: alanine:cation symporter family protein [Bacillota bacterium]
MKDMLSLTFKRGGSKAGVSSFQALAMSLGSRIGTGNIAGAFYLHSARRQICFTDLRIRLYGNFFIFLLLYHSFIVLL